jgi:O-antigen/teichoic acid export membrane protein
MAVFLMTSLNMAFSPWLAEKVAEDDRASIRKVTKFYILGFVFIAFGIMLLAPEILLIMGGKQYLEAKYVMPPIALCCVLQFLCTLFVNLEQIKKKTVGMSFASAGAAVVNVVLNYILMPRFGYVASGYSICISYVLLLLVHIGIVRKLGCGDMYDVKMMFVTIAGMLLLMMGVNFLYGVTWLRYVSILVYGAVFLAVAWKFRHLIFMVLRKDRKKKNAENA